MGRAGYSVMYREMLEATREEVAVDETRDEGADPVLTRRLLRAVETYKASCAVAGEEPTVEDGWLVLLSTLSREEDK